MMAELLNEALKIIIEKLISGAVGFGQTAQEIKSLFQDDPEKMMNTIEVFMVEVDQMQLTPPQLEMLKELGRVVQQMLDFQDETQTRDKRRKVMSTSSSTLIQKVSYLASSNPVVHAYKDARQFTCICKDLYLGPLARDIDGTRSLLDMMYKPPQRPTNSELTLALASGEVIGRDGDRDKILSLLASSTGPFPVLVITGIGGIGKTTLAQYLYCTECVKTKFDVLLWVEVGQVFILQEIIRKMVGFGTGERNLVDCEMAQLQNCILTLISGKKCLIVLDNVWDHRDLSLNWQELMKLNGYMGVGSRFIVTTRSESVARMMSNNDPYRLGDLDAQDAWRLFRKFGCRRQQLEPELERIGREIAELCGNVPLVIRIMGGLLREKPTTVEEWGRFRDDLGRRSCCDRESSILHILKFSYDQLHPKGLKRCFLHFSLFPRGFKVKENELIYQWRALGFVEKQENQSEMHAAHEYLLCLINRGLLLGGGYDVRMHDVIHDLVTSLAKSKYKRVNSDDKCDFGDETRHVSFTSTAKILKDDLLGPSLVHIKDQLRSLRIYRQEHPLNLKGLSKLKHLRVLTLYSCVEEVPSTIGKLIHLRYLDLPSNTFNKLPDSITQLVNLVYLNLKMCYELQKLPLDLCKLVDLEFLNLVLCRNLQELPRDINKLKKLLHLDLFGCYNLKHMPSGLGKLTGLQTLSRFVVSGHSWINGDVSGIADLNSLNNLKEELEIVVGGCCLPPSEVRAANLQAKEKLEWLWIEFKEGAYADSEVLEQFRPPSNLIHLFISGCIGRSPPSWIDDRARFLNLERLEIYHWEGFSCLGSFVRFPRLRNIRISDCKNMEYIIESPPTSTIESNDDFSASSSLFPRLEVLIIEDIPKLKGWRRNCISKSSGSAFPKLERLIFHNVGLEVVPEEFWGLPLLNELQFNHCEQLKEIPEWIDTFQSLKELAIRKCPRLVSLPKQIVNLTNLNRLWIQNCPNIKARSRGKDRCFMPGAGGIAFPKLEYLFFAYVGLECFPEVFRGLPLLNHLEFIHCEQLEEIPEWIDTFPSLRRLSIEDCPRLMSLPKQTANLTNLKELRIQNCPNMKTRSRGKDRCFILGAGGSSFPKLEILRFDNVGLECFPEEFRGLPLLSDLEFNHCEQLEEIPEWIDTFPSLWNLSIEGCPRLMSLPKQIANLTNLEELDIIDCPSLAERCQSQTGEDWHIIQHIPHIHIHPKFESQRFSPVL